MALGKALFHKLELGKEISDTIADLNEEGLKWSNSNLDCEDQIDLLNYLPEFLAWLNEQIKLDNQQFILGAFPNNLPEGASRSPQKSLIFLLTELLEQYSDYSGIAPSTIHEALREALAISHHYTLERNNRIIEVTPCLYPLHENLCFDLLNN